MSCSTGLQLAAERPSEIIFVEPAASTASLQQMNSDRPLPSYQQPQPQLILQPHRHHQYHPPGAGGASDATTTTRTTTTSCTTSKNNCNNNSNTNSHLAAVQSKRKEKARIAARTRRSQEASIIMEMAGELCISQEKLRRIDKATIVKLAIDYIRAHGALCNSSQGPPLCSHAKQMKNSHNNNNNNNNNISNNNDNNNNNNDNDNNNTTNTINNINDQRQQLIQLQHNYDDEQLGDQQHLKTRLEGSERATKHQRLEQEQRQEARLEDGGEEQQQQRQQQPRPEQVQQQPPLYSAPKLATASIFAPKTVDNMNPHFLMIEEKDNGKGAFVLKPDTEILDEDDLTHLAPQAGDISISLDVEPLEGIPLEDLLIPSPTMIQRQQLWMR